MPHFEVPRLGPWWVHCLSQMAFIAGASERVRIDSTVLVLPYHHPLALAKALSTIDQLSGGRLNISVRDHLRDGLLLLVAGDRDRDAGR